MFVKLSSIHVALVLVLGAGLQYPQTRTVDHVDTYHGVEVPDPYRWLEQDVRESAEVADWVRQQNEVTFGYLASIPGREAIKKRLTELWDYEKYSLPFKKGGRYYFSKNDGLQNQSVLYRKNALDDDPALFIDPNTWSEDGTVALAGTAFSDDGRYVAYGVSEAGSDWRTWRIMEIESGDVLDEEVKWSKASGVSWTKDGEGFFYGRFAQPEEGAEYQSLNLNMKVYYHRVGTAQAEDLLVYERRDHPEWGFGNRVTEDGKYLILSIWIGTDDRNRVVYKDLTEPSGQPVDLIDDFEDEFTFIGNDGPIFYFKTGYDAPNRRLISIDIGNPGRENWLEIISESPEALRSVNYVGNKFVASYLKDAKTRVIIFSKVGGVVREVAFPGIGSAFGFSGKPTETETFYQFSSYTTPPSAYRYDVETGESSLLRRANVDFSPDDYVVKQVFYESKDGTRVPMFLSHKKELKLDGNNRALLFGYGGFNIPQTPSFNVARLAWMEMGGVFAVANLRGGGEYGEVWHKAGTKLQKQNVFDDFIAAAEWLQSEGYTRPELLTIQGRSNGGLLVGAVMTQRPELFGVALPAVGVMDMLRFHKFTAGRYWVDDYGSADDPEEFKALLAYSPYHNIRPGVRYPPTLATTADTDDRVVPGHSFKFVAALQRAQAGDAPVLIRIETRAGHGGGKPTSKRIEEIADLYAFAIHHTPLDRK